MKKIPTLFVKQLDDTGKMIGISESVTPGMECILNGEGTATVKYDGSATCIKDGVFYKRYDCKKGKKAPKGFIPCQEPDPVSKHWPGWIKVDEKDPSDKWFVAAYNNSEDVSDGTYEAIGPHFRSNPYKLDKDILVKHGKDIIDISDRSYEGLKEYLKEHNIEGIVFWLNGEPLCKIRRKDFGFPWNR